MENQTLLTAAQSFEIILAGLEGASLSEGNHAAVWYGVSPTHKRSIRLKDGVITIDQYVREWGYVMSASFHATPEVAEVIRDLTKKREDGEWVVAWEEGLTRPDEGPRVAIIDGAFFTGVACSDGLIFNGIRLLYQQGFGPYRPLVTA